MAMAPTCPGWTQDAQCNLAALCLPNPYPCPGGPCPQTHRRPTDLRRVQHSIGAWTLPAQSYTVLHSPSQSHEDSHIPSQPLRVPQSLTFYAAPQSPCSPTQSPAFLSPEKHSPPPPPFPALGWSSSLSRQKSLFNICFHYLPSPHTANAKLPENHGMDIQHGVSSTWHRTWHHICQWLDTSTMRSSSMTE